MKWSALLWIAPLREVPSHLRDVSSVLIFFSISLSLSCSLFPGCEGQSRALEINHIRMDAWLLMGAVFVTYMHDEQLSLGGGRQLWHDAAAHSKRVA